MRHPANARTVVVGAAGILKNKFYKVILYSVSRVYQQITIPLNSNNDCLQKIMVNGVQGGIKKCNKFLSEKAALLKTAVHVLSPLGEKKISLLF